MIWFALALGGAGLFLSAFFSGSETGFYRATRVRLVLDALGGDSIARVLVWLTNRPSIFIATTLVGNNLANYLTSLAIVMVTQWWFGGPQHAAELVMPLIATPFIFLYGELLPKHLNFEAPNRLLRRGGPLFFTCVVLFAPITAVLYAMSKLVELLSGESPQQIRLAIARKELAQVLEEGHEAGLLQPTQRRMAQGLFAVTNKSVRNFVMPLGRVAKVKSDATRDELLRLARRQKAAIVVVETADGRGQLLGYQRVVDFHLDASRTVGDIRPLIDIPARTAYTAAMAKMYTAGERLARVVNDDGSTLGLLMIDALGEPLFGSAT